VGVIAMEDDAKNLQYNEHVRKAYLGLATTEDDVANPAHTPAHDWYPGQGSAAIMTSPDAGSRREQE
jgi:hypothetical protein